MGKLERAPLIATAATPFCGPTHSYPSCTRHPSPVSVAAAAVGAPAARPGAEALIAAGRMVALERATSKLFVGQRVRSGMPADLSLAFGVPEFASGFVLDLPPRPSFARPWRDSRFAWSKRASPTPSRSTPA